MSVNVLTLPTTTLSEPLGLATPWVRRALQVALLAVGALLTLWIVAKLGPVAYGLPAPFFRRAAAAPAEA